MSIDRNKILEVLEDYWNELPSALLREQITVRIYKSLSGKSIDGQEPPKLGNTGVFEQHLVDSDKEEERMQEERDREAEERLEQLSNSADVREVKKDKPKKAVKKPKKAVKKPLGKTRKKMFDKNKVKV